MKKIQTLAFVLLLILITNVKLSANESAKYFGSQEYQKKLYDLGIYWDRTILKLQENCMSQYKINPISFAILKPLKFTGTSTTPTDGIWTFRYKFTRCGESIIYNSLNIVKDNQPPKVIPLVPGTTNCDPLLIKDTLNGVYASLALHNSKNNITCKTANVLDTKITLPQTAQNKMWEEIWTVLECGKKIETPICFTPASDGGTNWLIGKCKK